MAASDLENLKALLLKSELEKIDHLEHEIKMLQQRLDDKEQLIRALKPILSDLLRQKITESRSEIADALAPVMGEAIKKQVSESREEMVEAIYPIIGPAIKKQVSEAKNEVADALYPVIGRTIRKSISEAMKNIIDSINQRANETLNFKKWWLLLKSKITGVSLAEYYIAGMQSFNIFEILLIQRQNGILLSNLAAEQQTIKSDADLISGMLTAIQDFARDSFEWQDGEELSQIQYQEHQIYIDAMPHTLLALVGKGIPPGDLREELRSYHEFIHKKYAKYFRSFNGDVSPFHDVISVLQKIQEKLTI